MKKGYLMNDTIKAIVYRGPGHMEIEEIDMPHAGPRDVVIKVKYSAICGGELHTYRSGSGDEPGSILGHEFIGYAVEVGEAVEGIEVGDRVWGMSANVCGECWYCQTGHPERCSHVLEQVTGHGVPGGHAQYVLIGNAIPGMTIYKIPDAINDERGALIEPFSVGCAEVAESHINEGDKVVVIGAGMIGNSIMQFAKLAGAEVLIADVVDARLDIALQCGADHVVNSAKTDLLEAVQEIWGANEWFFGPSGRADVVFDTAGVGNTLNDAVSVIRAAGKLVLVAPSEHDVNLNLFPVIYKNPEILVPMSGAYAAQTIETMAEGKLTVDPLIGQIFPFSQATKAFETQADPANGMKVLIDMEADSDHE